MGKKGETCVCELRAIGVTLGPRLKATIALQAEGRRSQRTKPTSL